MSVHKLPGEVPDDESPFGEAPDGVAWEAQVSAPGTAEGTPAGVDHDPYESERKAEGSGDAGVPTRPWFLSAGHSVTLADVMRLMKPDPAGEEPEGAETKRRAWSEDEIRDEEPEETDEADEEVSYRMPADDLEPEETQEASPGWEDCLEKALEAMKQLCQAYPGLPEQARPLQARRLTKEERNRHLFTSRQGERPETFDTPEKMLRRQALPMEARFWSARTMDRVRETMAGEGRGATPASPDSVLMYLPVGPVIDPKEEFLMAWWQWVWTHVVEPQPCDVPLTELLTAWRERLELEYGTEHFNEWMYREIVRSVTGYGSSIDEFPELLAELEEDSGEEDGGEEDSPF